jgi:hypothetical protein
MFFVFTTFASAVRAFLKVLRLLAAEFLPTIHQRQEAADSVYLLTFGLAELPESFEQFGRGRTDLLHLFLDLIEHRVEFAVDFKECVAIGHWKSP